MSGALGLGGRSRALGSAAERARSAVTWRIRSGVKKIAKAIRQALAPGGSVLVADEKVGDHFHAPADDVERLMYGWSIVHCLPVAMAEQPSAAIGTVIRADTVQALATGAGFPRVEVLPVDGGFFRLYRSGAQ